MGADTLSLSPTANPAIALRVLARLLAYPDAALLRDLPDVRAALRADGALSAASRYRLEALIDHLDSGDPIANQSAFVDLFDRGRATSLHLFEHVHGDSRERGPAMIDLAQTYAAAGLFLAADELPDYLPVIIEFVSTQSASVARDFLGEMTHLFRAIHDALGKRHSPYASVLGALLELAGEGKEGAQSARAATTGSPDDDTLDGIDESWAEPPAFGGCTTAGQDAASRAQTIRFAAHHSAAHPSAPPNAGSAPTE